MIDTLRRRWTLAPLSVRGWPAPSGLVLRPTSTADDENLAGLLQAAYDGTVDFEPRHDYHQELRMWREVDGADDAASFVATAGGQLVGTCLVSHELGSPFIYELAVSPAWQRRGVGKAVLDAALGSLAGRFQMAAAWVTHGNVESEALLDAAGFFPVTPPMDQRRALGHYRAASVLAALDASSVIAAASEVDAAGTVRLWMVVPRAQGEEAVRVRDVDVVVTMVEPDDLRLPIIAQVGMPLRGGAWLFTHRR
ncbi:MAG: GNAT family N-acetyltransferase [Mycobacteriales bacterium]